MDDARKHAYRFLLYWAMLDIRHVQWITYRPFRLLNPLILRRELRRASRAGAIADWMHNLAVYSAHDFDGFNEQWFWEEYEGLAGRVPEVAAYRTIFERRICEYGHERPRGEQR